MINLNPNVNSVLPNPTAGISKNDNHAIGKSEFSDAFKAVGKYISAVDDMQQSSDASIRELLSGKNNDITTLVSTVATADMSFRLLVGVRNKLIEAYKQTMNMPL
jgi:flagellar hook-basal body complex protein FliE